MLHWKWLLVKFWLFCSDLAVHFDGFIAATAHTLVVGCSKDSPVTDRRADVINAAQLCAEAAIRLVKPGNKVRLFTMFNLLSGCMSMIS